MTTVLHVSQPVEAGVPAVLLSHVADQVGRGWQVHVACPAGPESPLAVRAEELGARVHDWQATRSPGPSVAAETKALASIVAQVDPDVVLLHAAKAGLAGRLALRGGRPTVVMPHAWSFEAVTGPVRVGSLLWERVGSRWTDLTLCVSERERSVGEKEHCLGRRAVVVANGVDTSTFVPGDRAAARAELGLDAEAPLVVCIGRLARQKGQDVLLSSWPAVRAAVPDSRLVLVGDGPDRAELEGQAASLDGVTLAGAGAPAPWLAAADVVVLPSRWEGMPLVLLEAMSSGRSVVATDVAGAREALGAAESDSDWVVPVEDADALGAALVARLRDLDLRAQEERRHRERAVRDFDVTRATAQVATLLSELAADPGRSRRAAAHRR